MREGGMEGGGRKEEREGGKEGEGEREEGRVVTLSMLCLCVFVLKHKYYIS